MLSKTTAHSDRILKYSQMFFAALLSVLAAQIGFAQHPTQSSVQRIGVAADKQISLTLRDAVTMALENNREIEIERINTQINEFDLAPPKAFTIRR